MRVGFLHLIGGASGDMLLGALLDAGLPQAELEAELSKLPVSGYRPEAQQGQRGALHGTLVRVHLGGEGQQRHTFADFHRIVQESGMAPRVREQSLKVFQRLEEAERRAHRTGASQDTHLHELGSLDTLIDVVGVVAGLHLLGVERLYSSPLPLGSGLVKSGHGLLPAAAPATLELVSMARAPVLAPPHETVGESVTPTGTAIITTLASFNRPLMRLDRVGYGLGMRETSHAPNALALWLGQEETAEGAEALTLLETNIDDMSPQLFGYVQERLFALGALDVWFTTIQMKKNRPAVMLSALVPASLEDRAVSLLFQETTTLGVRTRAVQRHEAQREVVEVETSLGRVPVKVKRVQGRAIAVAPEYEVCRALAQERGIPLQEVLHRVHSEARRRLLEEEPGGARAS